MKRTIPVLIAGGMQQAHVVDNVTTMHDIKINLNLNSQMRASSNGVLLYDTDTVTEEMSRITFAAGSKNN